MNSSFVEQFMASLRKNKQNQFVFKTSLAVLAIFVFFLTYMALSPDAITVEQGNEITQATDVVYGENVPHTSTSETAEDTTTDETTSNTADDTTTDETTSDTADDTTTDEIMSDTADDTTTDETTSETADDTTTDESTSDAADDTTTDKISDQSSSSQTETQTTLQIQAPNRAPSNLTTGVDFTDMITSVVMEKEINGELVPTTQFQIGDKAIVRIKYTVPLESLSYENKNNKIYYQLPAGIKMVQSESGDVYDSAATDKVKIGEYTITEEGYIEITFNENFKYENTFIGTINFAGELTGSGTSEDMHIDFGNGIGGVDVEGYDPIEHDINVTKKQNSSDTQDLKFAIEVSSNNGSGDSISIQDAFTVNKAGSENANYDQGSFVIKKYKTVGWNETELETLNANDYLTIDNNQNASSFSLENLPALGENEKYKIEYNATPNGSVSSPTSDGNTFTENSVDVQSGDISKSASTKSAVHGPLVNKTGSFDNNSKTMSWTVTINPDGRNIDGFVLSDTVTTSEGESFAITSATLQSPQASKEISLPYTFPTGTNSNQSYTITYTKDIEEYLVYNKEISFNNTVDFTDNGDSSSSDPSHESVTYSKTIGTKAYVSTFDLAKSSTAVDKENGVFSWKSEITIPNSPQEVVGKFEYKDKINKGNLGEYNTSHYTTVGALKQIKIMIGSHEVLPSDYELVIHNIYYQDYFPEGDKEKDDTKIGSFEVIISSSYIEKYLGQKMSIEYDTFAPIDLADDNKEYIVSNTATIFDKESSVELPFEKEPDVQRVPGLTKTAYANGKQVNEDTVIDFDSIYNQSIDAGVLSYKIYIDNEQYTSIPEMVQDVLPENANLIENSVKYYFDSFWGVKDSYWISAFNKNVLAKDYITCTQEGDRLVFNIDDSFAQYFVGEKHNLIIEYSLEIPPPSEWNGDREVEFINSATCDIDHAISKVKVKSNDEYIKKQGFQVPELDENGNQKLNDKGEAVFTNNVKYTVAINKTKAKISDTDTNVVVIDTLTVQGSGSPYAMFDRSKSKLYEYDETKQDRKGALVDDENYSYSTFEKDGKYVLQLEVPDERAYIYEYEYTIDYSVTLSNDIEISNEVSIDGLDSADDSSVINFSKTTSNATAELKSLRIYKYEKGKENKPLPGATFIFDKYDSQTHQWVDTVIGTQTTDENGEIYLSLYDDYGGVIYEEDVLYRMTETIAPPGYSISQKPIYFVWTANGGDMESSADVLVKPDDIFLKDIIFIVNNNTVIPIENSKDNITVKKNWIDDVYRPISPNLDSIEIDLYKQSSELDHSFTVTVTSTANGTMSSGIAERDVTKTVEVAQGSPLTISVFNSANITQVFSIEGGQSYWQNPAWNSNIVTLNIEEVTSNMNITIKTSNQIGQTFNFFFFDFDEAQYRPVGEKTYCGTYSLTSSDKWQKSWQLVDNITDKQTQLPYSDESGYPYFYSVLETNKVDGFKVSYSDNNSYGIMDGNIEITNQMTGYELPATGGSGTSGYTSIAVALMTLSCGLYIYQRRKLREGCGGD